MKGQLPPSDRFRSPAGTRRLPGPIRLLGLAWSAALVLGLSQEPDPDLGKPLPLDGTITAVKGQTLSIELVSDAKTRAAVVEFLIRDFPLNGQLGPMVSKGEDRTKATITYTGFQDSAATSDSFTYAVRYPGGQWSRKGKVEIKLEASEPRIHATAEVDFGQVMIGQSEVREVFISNSGNASYRNQIQVAAPWSLVSPENGLLNLPVGGQGVVKVRYTPVVEGPATYHLAFFRNQGATTRLKAAAYAPFTIATPEVALRWEEKSRTRLGAITVNGIAPRVISAVARGDDRLKFGSEGALFLKPNEPSSMQIYLPSEDVAPYEGTMTIAVGTYSLPIKVTAGVAPPYLVVENTADGQPVIDFGQIKPGGFAQGSFQLRNAGGSTTKVSFATEAPFAILAAGGRATLDATEAEAFAVRVAAPSNTTGPYEGNLRIEADSGQSLRLALRAFFLPPGVDPNAMGAPGSIAPVFSAAGPPGAPGGSTPGSAVPPSDRPPDPGAPAPAQNPEEARRALAELDALRSPLGFVTHPVVERKISPSIPAVAGDRLTLVEDGRYHLTVAWQAPSVDADSYEMEMRVMRQDPEDGSLQSVWIPYHDVDYQQGKDGGFTAEIRGLGPSRTYEFRLFTIGQNDAVSTPLPFVATTRLPMDWTWIYASLALVAAGGAGYLGWRYHRSRSGRLGGFRFPRAESPLGRVD